MIERRAFDVLVVGAGPAGIASACAAAEARARVALVDDNPAAGGQIWRGGSPEAARWMKRADATGISLLTQTTVIHQPEAGVVLTTRGEIAYGKLILATGARERFLPFPGWTLPNVMGAGGLQALVKGGLPLEGRRVVVAGTGPLLLAVAAYLREHGAIVPLIAEQAPAAALARFAVTLAGDPAKLAQAARLKWRLRGTRYAAGTWPVAAEGKGKVEGVVLSSGEREPCDYLAAGFGLVPNLELPLLLGCATDGSFVTVNEWQETSSTGVYCAGEPTGIGGVDLALAGGRTAGYASTGRQDRARSWFHMRHRARKFQHALDEAFALRPELKAMAMPETVVCRCEDVPLGNLRRHSSWRAAKLQTRCGMGPCQGRVCGPAVEFLFGWRADSIRPPVFPVPVSSLSEVQR